MEKIRLKIREDIEETLIEVTTSSSDVADEEQICFTQADNENESDQHTHQREEQPQQDAKEWVANEEPFSLRTGVK